MITRKGGKRIRTSEVIAIEDGSNDIEMTKNAGIGVAMENATEKVKSYAILVIPSNDKYGVVIFLKELRRIINLRKK